MARKVAVRPLTRAKRVQNALRERFPEGVAPHGVWSQIAKECGVTREYVRQEAVKLGITIQRP